MHKKRRTEDPKAAAAANALPQSSSLMRSDVFDPWKYTAEELAKQTPSRKSGISLEDEKRRRVKASGFIIKMGSGSPLQLQMKPVLATARIMLQRFFVRQSFKEWDEKVIAAACIFLAAKSEDRPRKLHDVVQAYHKARTQSLSGTGSRVEHLDPKGRDFFLLKESLLTHERVILQTISFDLTIKHPYHTMIKMCKELKEIQDFGELGGPQKGARRLAQVAFNFSNDSMTTTVSLQHDPLIIAAGCIYLAYTYLKLPITESREMEKTNFGASVRSQRENIRDVAIQIIDVYRFMSKTKIEGEIRKNMLDKVNLLRDDTSTAASGSASSAK